MNFSPRTWLGAIAAVVLVAGTGYSAEISSDSFRITLPSQFGTATKTTTDKENIETTTWVSKAPSGEAVVVAVTRMPARVTDPTKMIDSTRDSLLKSVKGTLESEQTLAGDLPARRVIFRSGTAFLRSRLVVDGDRLYNVLYVGRSDEQRALPAVGQIFDSFQIMPQPVPSASAQ